jgi:hypothetical protein
MEIEIRKLLEQGTYEGEGRIWYFWGDGNDTEF